MIDFKKPIHRSKRDATIGGVCGGLANWAGWHPSVVRVAWILLSVFTGVVPGLAAYVVLWIYLTPEEGVRAMAA